MLALDFGMHSCSLRCRGLMQRLAVAFEAFTVDWTNPSTPTSDGVDEKVEGGVPLEGGRKVR